MNRAQFLKVLNLLLCVRIDVSRDDWRSDAIARVLNFMEISALEWVIKRALLGAYNVVRCDPPLTDAEVEAAIRGFLVKRASEQHEQWRRCRAPWSVRVN
jgi:hypothetical protein